MSSFHLPLSEMSITLNNVSCLLHLLIKRKLLNHGRINKDEALEVVVDYLRVDLEVSMRELKKPEGLMLSLNF